MVKQISVFDCMFSDVVVFTPDGYYLSKNLFSQAKALLEFKEELEIDYISLAEIECGFVRFQPTPVELRKDGATDMACG